MSKQIELIRQALSAAEASIRLAKQLLTELEKGKGGADTSKKALPGIIGTFDGENMVTEAGEKHPVPANYASKSMLVVGDTLKLVGEKGEKKFKQIEHVKRYKTKGTLTKKDGKYHAIASEGSYKVLPAAVDHFGAAAAGDEVTLVLPAKDLKAAYGAIESVGGTKKAEKPTTPATLPSRQGTEGTEKKAEDTEKKKISKKMQTKEAIKTEKKKEKKPATPPARPAGGPAGRQGAEAVQKVSEAKKEYVEKKETVTTETEEEELR